MLGQSMTKSITGLLTGIGVGEAAIRSLDDPAEAYVLGLSGSAYGETRLRDLLHMASGVALGEEADDARDLKHLWRDMVVGSWFGLGPPKGTLASLIQFNTRSAPAGTRFAYASSEPDVLAVVLRAALRTTLCEYLDDAIWRPIGAEADATWVLDAEEAEIGHFGFSAVLRDWARLGRLLAWDGTWEGRPIIPSSWVREATGSGADEAYLAPGRATPSSSGCCQGRGGSSRCWVRRGSDCASTPRRSSSRCRRRSTTRRNSGDYGRPRWPNSVRADRSSWSATSALEGERDCRFPLQAKSAEC